MDRPKLVERRPARTRDYRHRSPGRDAGNPHDTHLVASRRDRHIFVILSPYPSCDLAGLPPMWLGSATGGVKGNCLYVIVNKSCGALCVECTSDVGSRS